MLTICIHKGNANQNHTKIPPHPCSNSHHQKHHKQQVLARIWRKRTPGTLLVGMQASATTLEKKYGGLLKNLNIDLPYDPSIPLLGIYPKEYDTGYSRGTCTPMFTAPLFTIAKLRKQLRCPTIDEWIKKMWYLYTMEFYSAMYKNEILSFHVNGWNW
jgi:hypothetical protein